MKILSAAIVTTVLALSLAGTATAAPSKAELKKQPTKHVVVKKVVKKAPVKQIVKKVVKKKVVQRNYRVKAGDTLSRIAKRNNTSVQKLSKLNNLWGKKASNLRIGMVIRLG